MGPDIYLHVQWLENLNPLLNPFIDSMAGTGNRRYFDKLFPKHLHLARDGLLFLNTLVSLQKQFEMVVLDTKTVSNGL